ncbi:hypothetical protein KC678_02025, partial [Candidatus Dojkabacteria bacterium]|nr:hypothetical protein [Candidatus Dojkabacteria bacterium]
MNQPINLEGLWDFSVRDNQLIASRDGNMFQQGGAHKINLSEVAEIKYDSWFKFRFMLVVYSFNIGTYIYMLGKNGDMIASINFQFANKKAKSLLKALAEAQKLNPNIEFEGVMKEAVENQTVKPIRNAYLKSV